MDKKLIVQQARDGLTYIRDAMRDMEDLRPEQVIRTEYEKIGGQERMTVQIALGHDDFVFHVYRKGNK